MKIRKNVEAQLKREIEIQLDEMDIDGMVARLVSTKEVSAMVQRLVEDKIANIVQEKAYLQIKRQMPIIDAWTSEKVTAFLYELGVK